MRILDRAVYVGPSLYAHFPVIRLELDLGELEQWPSGKLGPAFTDALIAALPGLHEHGCSYGEPGGFIRRLTEGEGTWMGHILEHVAIELQNVAGEPVTFGKTRSQDTAGHYDVVYQYEQEDVGLEAGQLGVTLLHALLPPALRPEGSVPAGFDFAAERDEFIRFAQRRVAGPVMDMLFPPGTPSRIPIAAVTGTNGKTTTARMLAHIQKLAGHHVGLTSTDGVYIDGQRTVAGDMTGPVATRMVLSDPGVDVAVLEIARGGLLRAGMGVRHCDVGAVLNIKSDHLGLRGVGTLEDLAQVKRIVVEVARDTAILNADDPLCLKMADYTEAKHLCYVTMDPTHALVGEHIKAGGRGVVLESGIKGEMITIYDRGAHIPLLWTHLIPATLEGRAAHNVQNAMFAAAMAFSMGLKLEDVRHGLRTFDTTFFQAPGRMNIFDEHPFKVILDYGHNAAAVEVMCQLVSRLEVAGRRICVLAAPGDRRNEDIAEVGRIAAGHFDRYILRRDDGLRGRGPDEVPNLLRDALLEAEVPSEQVVVIPDEQTAIEAALCEAQPGDLVLIFADAITRSWKQVIQFRPEATGRPIDRTRLPQPEPAAMPAAARATASLAEDGRREFVRDGRGVRLAREEQAD